MKELEAPCKTCMHKTVCAYVAQTTRLIVNMNTDINSGNYPSNVVLNLSCTEYVRKAETPRTASIPVKAIVDDGIVQDSGIDFKLRSNY